MQSRTTSLTLDRKGRLQVAPHPAPRQPAAERVGNWNEVFLGFDQDTAAAEASRCIQCPEAPCMKACPLQNDIPGALWQLELGDPIAAANVFRETSNMPEVCSRVCPQEKLCEGACAVGRNGSGRPVQIGKLEQFCADFQRLRHGLPTPARAVAGPPMAVVGAGPAGIAAAEELAKLGHPVTIYDAWPRPGGNLRYGIPSFKLAKSVVDAKIAQLEMMGVRFVAKTRLGDDLRVEDLLAQGYVAVFLAIGASEGSRLNIPGEDLPGVYRATEFLARANLDPLDLPPAYRERLDVGERVVVIGGGDTAMDCVRSAIRLGARSVTCVYRRSEVEMPGRLEERRYARDEGVQLHFLAAPVRVLGQARVAAVECVRMELTEPDRSGRRGVRPIPGSEFTLEADTVVAAVGYRVEASVSGGIPGVQTRDGGLITVDPDSGQTSLPGVFAGGDLTTGPHLVVTAIAAGRRAARAMHQHASQAQLATPMRPPRRHRLDLTVLTLWRNTLAAEAEHLQSQPGMAVDERVQHRLRQIEFELELIDERIRETAGTSD